MMNYIWVGLVVIAVAAGAVTGSMEGVLNNIFDFASTAVDICLGLIGIMAFWRIPDSAKSWAKPSHRR